MSSNTSVGKDPVTGQEVTVIAYTVEEGGTFRYIQCHGREQFMTEFNRLYADQGVHVIRTFGLRKSYRRQWIPEWVEERVD